MELLIYPIIAVALFVIAFVFKKRFGLLGLALAAGSILSNIWLEKSVQISDALGLQFNTTVTATIAVILVLLPAGLLIFHGHNYKTLLTRAIGAFLFSLLSISLLISPMSRIVLMQGFGSDIYLIISNNQSLIIGACLIIAIIDKFLSKPSHSSNKHHKS